MIRLTTVRGLILLAGLATPAMSGNPAVWRFWTATDGFSESYTVGVATDREGDVWLKHGDVSTLSLLNGFSTQAVPDPGSVGRIYTGPDGDLWMFTGTELRHFSGMEWVRHSVPELAARQFVPGPDQELLCPPGAGDPLYRAAIAPLQGGHVLVLLPDILLDYDSKKATSRIFQTASATRIRRFTGMYRGQDGYIWVSGQKGVASITGTEFGKLQWNDFAAAAEINNLEQPRPGGPGEVLAKAAFGGGHAIVSFDGREWKLRYKARGSRARGWRTADGEIWVQDENTIYRLSPDGPEPVARREALAGRVLNVDSGADGTFWISTSQGIARYAPPLWKSPGAFDNPDPDTFVFAMAEQPEGTLWLVSSGFLSRYDRHGVKNYEFPPGERSGDSLIDAIRPVSGGKIALLSGEPGVVLLFDPVRERFEKMLHPRGWRVRLFAPRRQGGIYVQVVDPANPLHFYLESFDGREFLPAFDFPITSDFADIRAICETARGEIWVGSTRALGVYAHGIFRRVGRPDGFEDSGAFSLREISTGEVLAGGRNLIARYDGKRWMTIRQNVDRIRSIVESREGSVWFASGHGAERLRNGSFIENTDDDGLPSSVVNVVFEDRSGNIWAGTAGGASLYRPGSDTDPPDTLIAPDENPQQTTPDGRIRILFSGVDKWKFTAPGRLLFSWRLDGGPWTTFEPTNAASFRGLRPGAHRFEVRAMDRNGNADPEAADFEFEGIVPWYREKTMIGLAILALSTIVFLLRSTILDHQRLTFQSRHDPLTRLSNRMVFEANLQNSVLEAASCKSKVAVLLLDLDRFKPVNDTLGHMVGDRLLQEISRRLRSCIRKSDTLARMGGDEFAILMPDSSREEAEGMARRILESLRVPCRVDGRELPSPASIGISLFPEHTEEAASLLRLADLAMYQCKAQGKNNYCFFDGSGNRFDYRAPQVAELIREALAKGYFRLDYQPIEQPDGECVAVEALARIEHPHFGVVPPGRFISVAEDSGLIRPLGDWVLGEACRQLSEWRAAGHDALRVSINVSSQQLTAPDFAAKVKAALSEAKLDGGALIIEINETALMKNRAEVTAQLAEVRRLGVTVALDNFGAGASSFSSLHTLPVDVVKIDRSFIEGFAEGNGNAAVLEGLISLAHRLGLQVVAEGVEFAEQRQALRSAQVDLLQGFLLCPPQTAGDTTGRLLEFLHSREVVTN